MLTICTLLDSSATVIFTAGIPHHNSDPILNFRVVVVRSFVDRR